MISKATIKQGVVSAVLITAFATPVMAEKNSKSAKLPENLNARYMNILKRELLLSEEQAKQIEEIQAEVRENRKKKAEKTKEENEEMNLFLTMAPEGKDYDKVIDKTADRAADRARERIEQRADIRKKVYKLLNEEQKKKFMELSKPRKKMRVKKQAKNAEKGNKAQKGSVE